VAIPRLLGLLNGRHAEEPLELPAELRRPLVTDSSRGGACVIAVAGYEPLGPVEPDSLAVLERRAGRHEFEMVVEGRDAHARPVGQFLDAEQSCMLDVDVLHDSGDAGEVVVPTGQGTERPSFI
jgi:hypothetical protein